MFETIAIVAVILAIAIAVVLILAATKPSTFRVTRATSINAPAERIFGLIDDFRQWTVWSPYENRDPDMKRIYSGAGCGQGAAYAWEGNKNVGAGRMEILNPPPPSKIVIKLDFFSPFEAHNIAEFTMRPLGSTTTVTWAMHGPAPYMAKIMHMVFKMDRMVGGQFQQGLTSMKAVAEN